ncbi:hypothetical protein MUK70_15355 [Dyadobacter chenwenxiniae]|uniref:Uncharacterized protein n=1 Tax=Dyadobacter chenwenxiniae TaxID=2906456 RepID=A0A9X1PHW5_9BACT|nr:hypothetical protein [Dyadobacter chenwenxiniae]MCF0060620.1 hypothetical protein [Dyadobacter chenwenxiniae]UON80452.1 hypothetical protein MUK70_15355 [Dyadobacter chenwenxiniae]
MKTVSILVFVILTFSCKDDIGFNPNSYDGQYPKNMDGSDIQTYKSEILGGQIEASFNGHTWNHAPYLSINAEVLSPPNSVGGSQELFISISSLLTNRPIESCILETLLFRVPLATGITSMNKFVELTEHEYTVLKFTSINCDAGKDQYVMDRSVENTINVLSYDPLTGAIHAEFDLSFKISQRNSSFGPIYPERVVLKGRVETNLK